MLRDDLYPKADPRHFVSIRYQVAMEYLEIEEILATETYEELLNWLVDYHDNDIYPAKVIIAAFQNMIMENVR